VRGVAGRRGQVVGVEYAHYLLVRDPAWIGGIQVARRVQTVLERWNLVSGEPELFVLEGGRTRKLHGGLTAIKAQPPNLLVRYPHIDGGRAVAAVMGPSYFGPPYDDWRYLQGISLIIGTDFRIGPCSESLYVGVVRPPVRNGREEAPYPQGSYLWEFDDSYPADRITLPPETRIEAKREPPAGFTGVWRAGVMLDCGKDLPRIDGYGFGVRVSDRFAAELEIAFGTQLIEVGRVY
jgi:hypothetical protein